MTRKQPKPSKRQTWQPILDWTGVIKILDDPNKHEGTPTAEEVKATEETVTVTSQDAMKTQEPDTI